MTKKNKPPRKLAEGEIDTPALISALQQHILGGRKMTEAQVKAAMSLLKLKDAMPAGEDGGHEDALTDLE